MAYHTELKADDDVFTDLTDDRSYSYDEHWLVEIEFDSLWGLVRSSHRELTPLAAGFFIDKEKVIQ
jgi:hypothetical protein